MPDDNRRDEELFAAMMAPDEESLSQWRNNARVAVEQQHIANQRKYFAELEECKDILSEVTNGDYPERTDIFTQIPFNQKVRVQMQNSETKLVTIKRDNVAQIFFPPVGQVVAVFDQSGKEIFKNGYLDKPRAVQYANVFGRAAGVELAQKNLAEATAKIEVSVQYFEQALAALESDANAWLEKAAPLIYPQRQKSWAAYIFTLIPANSKFKFIIETSLSMMEKLSKTDLAQEEKLQLFEELKTSLANIGSPILKYAITETVKTYAKNGPEFMTYLGYNTEDLQKQNKIFEEQLKNPAKATRSILKQGQTEERLRLKQQKAFEKSQLLLEKRQASQDRKKWAATMREAKRIFKGNPAGVTAIVKFGRPDKIYDDSVSEALQQLIIASPEERRSVDSRSVNSPEIEPTP